MADPLAGGTDDDETARPTAHALAMAEFGLLAAPAPRADAERCLEDWIASQLDPVPEVAAAEGRRNVWHQFVDRLPTSRRAGGRRPPRDGRETAFAEWSRFRVAYRRGVTVVRMVGPSLIKERVVRGLARDLLALLEAGNRRLILNFSGVEKVGSWTALAIDEIYRRARAFADGDVKLCGLPGDRADVLKLAGMAAGIERYPDEDAALEATWPGPSVPRTLPVDILLALCARPDLPPVRGGAPSPSPANGRHGVEDGPMGRRPRDAGETGLWLIVQMGSSRGRPIAISGPRFVVGRHRDCQLRLGLPMVSKLHAAIERREGRIVLVDLGSTNGTMLNGRVLRGREAELHDGDRIQIGPVVGTIATAARREGHANVEEKVAEWLHGEDPARGEPINAIDTAVLATTGPAVDDDEGWNIRSEIIQGVLVVTPETGELEDEATVERVREHLHALLSEDAPRRVVLNMEYVAHVTGRAIGMLLAHHLRLDRSGGGLRIGQARAGIMAVLHQVRLTMLIECHPTLDEAVLSAWPGPRA